MDSWEASFPTFETKKSKTENGAHIRSETQVEGASYAPHHVIVSSAFSSSLSYEIKSTEAIVAIFLKPWRDILKDNLMFAYTVTFGLGPSVCRIPYKQNALQ